MDFQLERTQTDITHVEQLIAGRGQVSLLQSFELFLDHGGGGFGDPRARDPKRVEDDVTEGFVTQ